MSNDFNLEDFNLEDYNFMTADILNNKRVNNKRVNNKNMTVSVVINNLAIDSYIEGINAALNSINKDISYELLQEAIKQDIIKYIYINIE